MPISRIEDHVDAASGRLLSQLQRPKAQAFVAAIAGQVQQLEDSLFSILNAFNLDTAVGAQLDTVAALFGLSRYGLTDDQLRVLIRGIVALNNGSSTSATLVSVAKALFQTDQVFFADGSAGKHAPQVARSTVILGVGTSALPQAVISLAKSLLGQAVGAGIRLLYVANFASSSAFAMQGNQAWVQGYASVASPTSGGKMAGLL